MNASRPGVPGAQLSGKEHAHKRHKLLDILTIALCGAIWGADAWAVGDPDALAYSASGSAGLT